MKYSKKTSILSNLFNENFLPFNNTKYSKKTEIRYKKY